MLDVTDNTVEESLNSAELPVLMYVWAPWCGPCKMVGAALERVAAKASGRFQIVKANMEEFEVGAERYEVKTTPTLIIFQNGQELCRRSGAVMEGQITAWLNQNLPAS
ncbi:thioredoxin domain-containing protein [Neptuniibacter sp.]|uniref:thioredoxin family protein n=1 Tax=Neptuniibacter sp. TaxID=1962643 RepID=UPI00262EE243|nr:thioredoxin domain-containing protein [Neptuniibacter sp.]MCP4598035.1 thiol reductase thioredoxin [Neptuniibacter sp.]